MLRGCPARGSAGRRRFLRRFPFVEHVGFEPTTSCMPCRRSNQAELMPREICLYIVERDGFEPSTPCLQSRCSNRTELTPRRSGVFDGGPTAPAPKSCTNGRPSRDFADTARESDPVPSSDGPLLSRELPVNPLPADVLKQRIPHLLLYQYSHWDSNPKSPQ